MTYSEARQIENEPESPFAKIKPINLARKISRSELMEIINDSRESSEKWFEKVINEKTAN